MTTIANLREFEALARARLSPAAYAYYAGGSWDEQTMRDNEAAFARRRLLPRVLGDVATVGPGPRWLQLYVQRDRGRSEETVNRAAAAGYGALVLTVDSAGASYRERELREGRRSVRPGRDVRTFLGTALFLVEAARSGIGSKKNLRDGVSRRSC